LKKSNGSLCYAVNGPESGFDGVGTRGAGHAGDSNLNPLRFIVFDVELFVGIEEANIFEFVGIFAGAGGS